MSRPSRGLLIVFEGCDRTGKSTQVQKLVTALNQSGLRAEAMKFPDRSTNTGKTIDAYLRRSMEMEDHSVHLLFSANRWELKPRIMKLINSGTTLVVDRYAYSGAAFTAAKQICLDWCKAPDKGLPTPDVVFYLKLSPELAESREEFGSERYENIGFQKKVEAKFECLKEHNWYELDAAKSIELLHGEILRHTTSLLEKQDHTNPLGKLWVDKPCSGP